jgi:hypothetical protein
LVGAVIAHPLLGDRVARLPASLLLTEGLPTSPSW